MKNQFDEKHPLPLAFKYLEENKNPKSNKMGNDVPYGKSKKHQTDFLLQVKPYKQITRLR